MENYIKAVLYAYPLLKNVGEDYAEHIKNKAVLSYKSNKTAEALAEYLAGEILYKNRLVWLREVVKNTVDRLSENERTLLAIRYFGKKRKASEGIQFGNDRKYFRIQQRLGEKVAGMLRVAGITKDLFEKEFAEIEIFKKICKHMERLEQKRNYSSVS